MAFELAASGSEVHAVTSRMSYDDPAATYPAEDLVQGVHVHRLWTTRFGRGSLAGRACDYMTFYASAAVRLMALLRAGDVVVVKTDPPLISVVAAVAARMRGARLVNWLQDVFPEAASLSGFASMQGALGWLARAMRNWSWRSAAVNVVVGQRMGREVGALVPGVAQRVIANWADGNMIRPMRVHESRFRNEWGLSDRFVVGYSGNLGRVHDLETIIGAARLLSSEPDVHFSFVGGGFHFGRLREASLPNASTRSYVPKARLADALSACDVHLITLLPRFEGLIVPSKFYGAAAAGRAVIFVGDPNGEIAGLITTHGCGVVVKAGDAAGLAAAIQSLRESPAKLRAMGALARDAFEREWDKPIALARWREVIAAVAGPEMTDEQGRK